MPDIVLNHAQCGSAKPVRGRCPTGIPTPALSCEKALLQQFDKDFIAKPFSYRCTVWMHKHLSEFKCADGYRFKQHELGRIADCEFTISFRRIDSEGYPI